MQIFDCLGVGVPKPCVVQGSTVYTNGFLRRFPIPHHERKSNLRGICTYPVTYQTSRHRCEKPLSPLASFSSRNKTEMGLGGLQNSHSEGRPGGSRPTWSEALSTSPRDTSAHSPGKGTKRLEEKEKKKSKALQEIQCFLCRQEGLRSKLRRGGKETLCRCKDQLGF